MPNLFFVSKQFLKNRAASTVCTAQQDFSRHHGEFEAGIGFGAASAVAMCWRSTAQISTLQEFDMFNRLGLLWLGSSNMLGSFFVPVMDSWPG